MDCSVINTSDTRKATAFQIKYINVALGNKEHIKEREVESFHMTAMRFAGLLQITYCRLRS